MQPAVTIQTITPQLVLLKGNWEARIFRDWNIPEEITREWQNLALAHGDEGLFLQPGWFKTWFECFQPDELFLAVLTNGGKVFGLFPCCMKKGEDESISLSSMGTDGYFDFLVAPCRPEHTIAAFVELLAKMRLPSPMRFNHLLETSWCNQFRNSLRSSGFPYWNAERPFAPYVDFRALTWEEYDASLHPKLKNNLKKGLRRAEREGRISFEVVAGQDCVKDVLAEAIQVEGDGWKGAQGSAIRCSATKSAWYRGLAGWAAGEGRLRLFVLRLNERMIAFDFCIAGDKTIFAVKTGYDENFAGRLSPGNLMRYELMRHLFKDAAFSRYDFMGECNPWKLEWTNASRRCTWLRVYPRSARGWEQYLVRHAWKEPLKHSETVKNIARRLGWADRDALHK